MFMSHEFFERFKKKSKILLEQGKCWTSKLNEQQIKQCFKHGSLFLHFYLVKNNQISNKY